MNVCNQVTHSLDATQDKHFVLTYGRMTKTLEKKIREPIQKTLEKQEEALFGYVFGSAVTGTRRKGSDVDIAVYLVPEHQNRFFDVRLELLEQLTKAIPGEADVTILNTAAPFLKYVVLQEGKLVFERSRDARIDFELKTLNEYFDYKPVLERYRNRLRSFV